MAALNRLYQLYNQPGAHHNAILYACLSYDLTKDEECLKALQDEIKRLNWSADTIAEIGSGDLAIPASDYEKEKFYVNANLLLLNDILSGAIMLSFIHSEGMIVPQNFDKALSYCIRIN